MAIKKCVCKHADQDVFYGQGMRVHNLTIKKNWRCTICGKEVAGGFDAKSEKAKK